MKTTVGELFEEAVQRNKRFEAHGIFWAVMNDLLTPTDPVEEMWKIGYDKRALLLLEKYNVLAHGALRDYEQKSGLQIALPMEPGDSAELCRGCLEGILEGTVRVGIEV